MTKIHPSLRQLHGLVFIFVCSVARLVALPIREVPNPALNDIAEASFDAYGPVIYYNPTVVASADRNAVVFFRAHEYAHHWLRHLAWRNAATQVGLRHPYSREAEMEADCFAARMLAWQNPRAVLAATHFFEAQGDRSEDVDHPTGAQRAQNIQACQTNERGDNSEQSVVPESEPYVPFEAHESDPGALGDLEFVTNDTGRDQELFKWNTDGHPPTVDVKYRFRNRGARAIHCEVILTCGTAPRNGSGSGLDMSKWIPFYTKKVALVIPSGAAKNLEEQLFWQVTRPKNTVPSVRLPIPMAELGNLLVKATYVDQPAQSGGSFCTALTRIIGARRSGFDSLKVPGSGEKDNDGDYTWRCSVALPESLEASISTIDKKPQYDALVFKSGDSSAVEAHFAKVVEQLTSCLGDGWTQRESNRTVTFRERSNPDSGSITVKYSSKVDRVSFTVYSD